MRARALSAGAVEEAVRGSVGGLLVYPNTPLILEQLLINPAEPPGPPAGREKKEG